MDKVYISTYYISQIIANTVITIAGVDRVTFTPIPILQGLLLIFIIIIDLGHGQSSAISPRRE